MHITDSKGNTRMYSKLLLIVALELEQELTSPEIVADGLIDPARNISVRSGLAGTC